MFQWTSGKQFFSRGLGTQVIPIADKNCARAVASVFAGFGDGDDIARLMVAAPDLLEAAKLMTREIHLSKLNIKRDFSLINAHAAATKAIAKAEGMIPADYERIAP